MTLAATILTPPTIYNVSPGTMAVSSDGTTVAVLLGESQSELLLIDAATGSIAQTIQEASGHIAFTTADGSAVYYQWLRLPFQGFLCRTKPTS
jgi:DNA-binding beta-propeller fold protein YncE